MLWTSSKKNPSPGHHLICLVFIFFHFFFSPCHLTSLDFRSLCSDPWLLHTISPSTALTSNRIILLPQLIGQELSGFNSAINLCSMEAKGQERGGWSGIAIKKELINANEFTGITPILQTTPESHIATQTHAICLHLTAINNSKDGQFALFAVINYSWQQQRAKVNMSLGCRWTDVL